MFERSIVYLEVRFDFGGDRVYWVSVWTSKDENELNGNNSIVSLCCFVMPEQGIVHLDVRFDFERDRAVWVSVWRSNDENEISQDIGFVWLRSFVVLSLT